MKKKIALITGNFLVLHSGHIRLFEFAKENADYLYVGIIERSANELIPSSKDRLLGIENCQLVDHCEIISSIPSFIKKVNPDIIVKGSEFRKKKNIEESLKNKLNFELLFSKGLTEDGHNFHVRRSNKNEIQLKIPKEYIKRHKIDKDRLIKSFDNFKHKNVVVFGDIILDEYLECESEGVSREDIALVVNKKTKKKFIGGASIVASHLSSLGSKVNFFSVAGKDTKYNFIKKNLNKQKILLNIIYEKHRQTSLKQRYRVNGKSLFRVNEISHHPILIETEKKIYENFKKIVSSVDLVVFSDFNYGFLTDTLIKSIIILCKKYKITTVADSQTSSQIGNITKYNNIDLLTPTEYELRIGLRNNSDNLTRLSNEILEKNKIKNLVVKLGSSGNLTSILKSKNNLITDQLPSLAQDHIDLMGAGDAFLASSSLALTSNLDIWHSSLIGSIASAIHINTEGNKPINFDELVFNTKKILS